MGIGKSFFGPEWQYATRAMADQQRAHRALLVRLVRENPDQALNFLEGLSALEAEPEVLDLGVELARIARASKKKAGGG